MTMSRGLVRTLCGGLILVAVLAGPAAAHDPIFVDDATPLSESPIILDGSISFAVYGTITDPGGSSHVRLDLADGNTFVVELLVPDRAPENGLDDFSHLTLTAAAPEGSLIELQGAGVIDRFDEPFSGTSYLRTIEFRAPAVAGTYELTITSARPTRFTVATGQKEQFGTEVANYERGSLDALAAWYATPPPEAAPATSTAPATTEVAPPPPSLGTSRPTTSTSSATVARSPEPDDQRDPSAEAASATTESSDGSDGGVSAAALVAGVTGLVAGGWWLSRRRSRS